MKLAQDPVSQAAASRPDEGRGVVPAWLRWFANFGLSLSAATCAITQIERSPATVRSRSPALRGHV